MAKKCVLSVLSPRRGIFLRSPELPDAAEALPKGRVLWKMAKKCVVSVISRLLRGFFGFGGFIFQQLFVSVIDGGPEDGGAAAAAGKGLGTFEMHDSDLPLRHFLQASGSSHV